MLYFAYGTNMDRKQMASRCPSAKILSRAKLDGYKFIFNSRGVGTIIPAEGFEVHGVLYETDGGCLKNLDQFEGHPDLYIRERVDVIDEGGNRVGVIVYIATNSAEGQPLEDHLNRILEGARESNLPLEYIQNLKERYGEISN